MFDKDLVQLKKIFTINIKKNFLYEIETLTTIRY